MRILVLNYEFPPLGGGGGRVTYNLVNEWTRFGYKIDIITSKYKGLSSFETKNNINIYRVAILKRKNINSATILSMLSFVITCFIKGFQLCKKHRYDTLNTFFVIPTGPVGYLLSKIFKIKNILNIIGGDIYNPNYKIKPHKNIFLKSLIRFIINKASTVIAYSNDIKEKTFKYYNIDNHIKVIPIGYKPYKFKNVNRKYLSLNEKYFYLISVGRLVYRKRIDRIIKAISKLENNKIKLIILGNGPEKENLKNLTEKLNLKKRVIFLGFVSEEEKYQYLNYANAFISTSEHEGFGINFQEALYCGLPIILTKSGGPESFLISVTS